jgi:glutathione S-transferase
VPYIQDGDFVMFESGAIVLHIAEKSPVLSPSDPEARLRMHTWLIAALREKGVV